MFRRRKDESIASTRGSSTSLSTKSPQPSTSSSKESPPASRQASSQQDQNGTMRRFSKRQQSEDMTAALAAQSRRLAGCPLPASVYDDALSYKRPPPSSRLYTGFTEIVQDEEARGYFLQYLEDNESANAINFLLETKALLAAYQQCKSNQTIDTTLKNRILERFFGQDALPLPIPPEIQVKLTSNIDETALQSAAEAVEVYFTQDLFPSFLQSHSYASYCSHILMSPNLQVEDVLNSDEVLMIFMQFIEKSNVAIIIHFWLLAANFATTFQEASSDQVKEDAMGIYNRFFSLQSPEPLGVDEPTRTAIEANICQQDGIKANCFEDALHLVYTALRLHFFPLFKESEEFSLYLRELSKRGIDHSSETSTPVERSNKLVRKYSHDPARLGYVDEYGYFVRDATVAIEPSLDDDVMLAAVVGGGIGSLVKSALTGKTKTPQEELLQAWDMAKSNIREIRDDLLKGGALYQP
eukprot:m.7419 g.7419  ORF g.7419 m.7419 type:complete len:469 (+) comp5210_c0_seq1:64-1470(+)